MSDVTWNMDPGEYLKALTRRKVDAIEWDIVRLVNNLAPTAQVWMQENARWQDQSGDARAGLWADIEHAVKQSVTLLLSHDVTLDYTWFLEANPKFALLGDASDQFWPLLYRGAVEIARRHSG